MAREPGMLPRLAGVRPSARKQHCAGCWERRDSRVTLSLNSSPLQIFTGYLLCTCYWAPPLLSTRDTVVARTDRALASF